MKKKICLVLAVLLVVVVCAGCGTTSFTLANPPVALASPTLVITRTTLGVAVFDNKGTAVTTLDGYDYLGTVNTKAVFVNKKTATGQLIDTTTHVAEKPYSLVQPTALINTAILSGSNLWITTKEDVQSFSKKLSFPSKTLYSGTRIFCVDVLTGASLWNSMVLGDPQTKNGTMTSTLTAFAPVSITILLKTSSGTTVQLFNYASFQENVLAKVAHYTAVPSDGALQATMGVFLMTNNSLVFVETKPIGLSFSPMLPLTGHEQLLQSGTYCLIFAGTSLSVINSSGTTVLKTTATMMPTVVQGVAFYQNGTTLMANKLGTTQEISCGKLNGNLRATSLHQGFLSVLTESKDKYRVQTMKLPAITTAPVLIVNAPFGRIPVITSLPGKTTTAPMIVSGETWDDFGQTVSVTVNGLAATMTGTSFSVSVPTAKAKTLTIVATDKNGTTTITR